jgi:hypothetical protein
MIRIFEFFSENSDNNVRESIKELYAFGNVCTFDACTVPLF